MTTDLATAPDTRTPGPPDTRTPGPPDTTAPDAPDTAYTRLMRLLADHGVCPRVLDHPPEGGTAAVSLLRGHPLHQAAKCIVLRVRGAARPYVLAVVPGDHRVDIDAVRALVGGTRAGFADRHTAQRLTGCVSGAITPFSFDARLRLVVDTGLLDEEEIFFNAARLDRSLAVSTRDYRRIAAPLVADISDRTAVQKATTAS
ncbi:YbaK/EbsC family protein [Streptomyces sp. KLOTTS4A1]|uniref:YbaK/EbsC family protein n=1 Tax=Streptomyces sp. KLOTTS4A1 TaxID=3390996 RepID=UPI0039F51529